MARKNVKTTEESSGIGEYQVDLSRYKDTPLSEVLGNLTDPMMLGDLQQRLWNFLRSHHVLEDPTDTAHDRDVSRAVPRRRSAFK
jgi:hypothetical protein